MQKSLVLDPFMLSMANGCVLNDRIWNPTSSYILRILCSEISTRGKSYLPSVYNVQFKFPFKTKYPPDFTREEIFVAHVL